ncbi:hypothetical protein [Aquimarina sp. MAR_2010_214]|uniref:hypothetical protein n=1 Tax=Aquimarina sp. MAR_2010_214 TaxID=1250026 RepID=UPI0013040C7F|nr:hypothetical protein [Aquimarina sp. MAR_2010_214]
MKKRQLKKLKLNKNTISRINSQKIKGGTGTGDCDSSIAPNCNFACATGTCVSHRNDC